MKVTIDKLKFNMYFSYGYARIDKLSKYNLDFYNRRRVTCCRRAVKCVIENKEGIVLGWGFAVCNPKDQFVKSFGRKIAFTNALNDAEIDRQMRTRFWECYHNRGKSSLPVAQDILGNILP